MSTTSPATDHALPAVTPGVLALLLGAIAALAGAGPSVDDVGSAGAWIGLWVAGAVLALLGSLRPLLPPVAGPLPGLAWLAAGSLGGALLGRHAVRSFLAAYEDFAADHLVLPGLDQADGLLLLALLIPAGVIGLASRLRSPQPALLLPALLGLAPVVVLAVGAGGRSPRVVEPAAPELAALLVPAALVWAVALPGPAALPLSGRRWLAHKVAPRVLGAAAVLAVPLLLLAARSDLEAGVPTQNAGVRVFGAWGGETAAGIECFGTLVALHVLLVLCARTAARSLPWLRSGVFPLLAAAAALLAAWTPIALLVPATAAAGWLAVALGAESETSRP